MSLLASFRRLYKIAKPGLILLIPVFLSCETSDDIGVQYELDSGADVNFLQFSLTATNIVVDSLRTDGENRVLFGNYQDDLIGSVSAESYFSMRIRSTNLPSNRISDDFFVDSVRFAFESTISAPLAQERMQSFEVHLLEDTLSSLVFLSSKSEVLRERVGSFEDMFTTSDTLIGNFLLENSFANALFDNIIPEQTILGITEWPSLALVPAGNSQAINELTLDADTTGLYLFITDPDGIEEVVNNDTTFRDTTYVVEFNFFANTVAPGYVNIERNKAGSPFANLTDNDTLDLPDGSTMIDVLGGISTRMSIDPIEDFFNQIQNEERAIIINNATLSFNFDDETLRDTLENFYSFHYRNNDFVGSATVSSPFNNLIISDNGFLRGQNDPAASFINRDRTELVLNATLFFQQLYNDYISEEGGSLSVDEFILISRNDVTLQRAIIPSDGITLNIYFTEVN